MFSPPIELAMARKRLAGEEIEEEAAGLVVSFLLWRASTVDTEVLRLKHRDMRDLIGGR
jgi:hypothetical protein